MPLNIGLSDKNSVETISSMGSGLGDSMTSLLGNNSKESIEIFCMRWENWNELFSPEIIDFIKIDIEGGEFDLIPTLKSYLSDHKPVVYLSLHTPFLNEADRKEKMQVIVDTMRIYRHCYNENLEEIQVDDLTSDENLQSFNAFIFKD